MQTTSTDLATVRLATTTLIPAARALATAGRWQMAIDLVDDAIATDRLDGVTRAALAWAAAEIAVECDYVTGTHAGAARIATAEALFDETPGIDDAARWDLGFLRLRHLYGQQIFGGDDEAHLGPEGRDVAEIDGLRERAARLREQAPDGVRRGWTEQCLGWIADNLYGLRDVAPGHYQAALAAGESGADDLLVREALRHLGDHDHDHGDAASALDKWQRATTAGARSGTVAGTLSQQILLAVVARDGGDEAGARLLAGEIARWAAAIGAVRIEAQARAFLNGADPTAPPESQ